MQDVTIISPFRDREGNKISRYIEQVTSLDHPYSALRFVAIEGDSVDNTYAQLKAWEKRDNRVTVVKYDTMEPRYPSIVSKERFTHLAKVFNAGFNVVDCEWSTHTWFLPSDVMFNPDTLKRLLEKDKDCIAPMFWRMSGAGLVFYDVWGFVKDGEGFKPFNPVLYKQKYGEAPIPMDRIGGANLSKIEVIKAGVRYQPEDVDHGFCRKALEAGFELWADPTSHIVHEAK